jgi:hypothetical protein
MRRILITALYAFTTAPAMADEWTFSVEPYVLAASIAGDASIGRVTGVEIDVDFSTILEKLEMAAMVHFEAHSGNGWGFALDYGFMDLQYKALWVDYEDGSAGQAGYFAYDTVTHGPIVGLKIEF